MAKVDFHVHTKYSDGNLSLLELINFAQYNNVEHISITDHETIINLKKYKELEMQYNMKIIPGVEIPADYEGVHILGYGIKDFEEVEKFLLNIKKYNEIQNKKTIKYLQSEGIDISFEKIKNKSDNNIVTYRDIVKYMVEKEMVSNARDVYRLYIGKETNGYFPSKAASIEEVINLIDRTGGISVLAHPYTLNQNEDYKKLILNMKEMGLTGIEIYPEKLDYRQLQIFTNLTKKYDLIQTIGTDFHDYKKDKIGVEVSDEYLNKIYNKILKKK